MLLPPNAFALICARPAVSLGSPRSCSLPLVCPRRCSSSVPLVSGPHLSPLGCPQCARHCSSPSICWSPFLFGFRSRSLIWLPFVLVRLRLCSFGLSWARLCSFALWWVSFWAPQPLMCVCIKYMVSMIRLTFIPCIINLCKSID